MVGSNCAIPGCGTSHRHSYSGVGLFRVSQKKSQDFIDWRSKTLNIVKKYRTVDRDFKRQIESGNIYICEKHYQEGDIELTSELINQCYI